MGVSEDVKAKAVALKNQGNDAFKKHDWDGAIDFYSKAIELDDSEPTYFSNRAQVGSLSYLRRLKVKLPVLFARVTNNALRLHRHISRQKHLVMRLQMRRRRSS